jgi:O-antigen/teichoic acid export membrane protein
MDPLQENPPVVAETATRFRRIERLSLRRNFAWTLVGNVVYAACQWVMLVVLAKLGSPQKVGLFALGLAVTAPVIQFSNLQLRGIQATDAREEFQFPDYLGLRLAMTGLALVVIAAIAVFAGYGADASSVIVAVGLAKAFESVSDVIYGLMQHHERMDRIARSMLIKGPLSLVALGICVWYTGSVFWGSMGLAAAWLIVLLTYDIHSAALLRGSWTAMLPQWNTARLRRLAVQAAPLGLVMLLVSLNTNVPRYFIERLHGTRDLGIFAAITYLMVAGTTVVAALGQSASPRLARHFARRHTGDFSLLMWRLVLIGAALGLIGVLVAITVGRPLLTALYRPEYGEAAPVFVWAMAAAGLTYMANFVGYGLTAARQFLVQAPLFLVVTLTTVVACALLVPRYGILGATWALLVAGAVQLAGSSAALYATVRRARVHPE